MLVMWQDPARPDLCFVRSFGLVFAYHWRCNVVEWLDILSGGKKAQSVLSTGRSKVHIEREKEEVLMLACFFHTPTRSTLCMK